MCAFWQVPSNSRKKASLMDQCSRTSHCIFNQINVCYIFVCQLPLPNTHSLRTYRGVILLQSIWGGQVMLFPKFSIIGILSLTWIIYRSTEVHQSFFNQSLCLVAEAKK